VSGCTVPVPDHDRAAGACVPGVSDCSFNVLIDCGGV
jgi:hypothetical protein